MIIRCRRSDTLNTKKESRTSNLTIDITKDSPIEQMNFKHSQSICLSVLTINEHLYMHTARYYIHSGLGVIDKQECIFFSS